MRKISEEAARAFLNGEKFLRGNTECKNGLMLLHGNTIALNVEPGFVMIRDSGWRTSTTKERLNAILTLLGEPVIKQKAGVWYLGERAWKKNKWNRV